MQGNLRKPIVPVSLEKKSKLVLSTAAQEHVKSIEER